MVITEPRRHSLAPSEAADSPHLREEIQRARHEERRRLSAEIHDGAVQWIVGALYRVKACRTLASPPAEAALKEELLSIEASLKQSVGELRRLITALRPLPLEELGLLAAVHQKTIRLQDDGIDCRLQVEGELPKLTAAEERAAFGIIQEALPNAQKHAGASRVLVHLRLGGTCWARVIDNGRGFVPDEALQNHDRPDHIGLSVMRDRAQALGARLDIDSLPGQGTAVRLAFRPASQRAAPFAVWR
jgi:two-component system sensor histidine kinase DegS